MAKSGLTLVIIVDQFGKAPSPYALQQKPMQWEQFEAEARAGKYDSHWDWRKTQFVEVDLSLRWQTPHCTTAYKRAADGTVEALACNWDSSG